MQWNATYETNKPFFHKASKNIRLEYDRARAREKKKAIETKRPNCLCFAQFIGNIYLFEF